MSLVPPLRNVTGRFLPIGTILVGLAACTGGSTDTATIPTASYGCLDDSKACIDHRQAALKGLLADKSNGWVRHQATPESYAAGVRLYAFKQRKRELSCDDLAHGRREADGAGPALRGAAGRLTPAQISRGAMFATEVSRELAGEMGRRRCRA